jgi:hypothetical protein
MNNQKYASYAHSYSKLYKIIKKFILLLNGNIYYGLFENEKF